MLPIPIAQYIYAPARISHHSFAEPSALSSFDRSSASGRFKCTALRLKFSFFLAFTTIFITVSFNILSFLPVERKRVITARSLTFAAFHFPALLYRTGYLSPQVNLLFLLCRTSSWTSISYLADAGPRQSFENEVLIIPPEAKTLPKSDLDRLHGEKEATIESCS